MEKGIWISVCLFAAIGGFLLGKMGGNKEEVIDFSEHRSVGEFKYISPLLECDDVELSSKASLVGLRRKIEEYIESQKKTAGLSQVSVYYRDLNNGPWMGIDERELFSPASMVKVPLMMAYFKLAEDNPEILDREILFEKKENVNLVQQVKPSAILVPETSYRVRDLIEHMIVQSDNDAYSMLLEALDNRVLYKVYEDMGIDIASAAAKDQTGNILTVRDNAAFYRILFNASYLSKKYSELALSILARSEFNGGLKKFLPSDIVTAHKFGEREYQATGETQFHDCGIIYKPKHPYLLCVMTRGANSKNLVESIATISDLVFKSQQ